MKRLLLEVVLGATAVFASAQTATDFNCDDCTGTSHALFAELDAGKVIVLVWVMPCAACVGPALTTYNVVQSYQASDPDRVLMYLVDDYANTNCASLNSWRNSNNLTEAITFSNAAIDMGDYGSDGMPKIVVVGGSEHTVFYNANNTVNASSLQNGIEAALAAVGVAEQDELGTGLLVYPDPVTDRARVSFTLGQASDVSVGLNDLSGKLVKQIRRGALPQGEQSLEIGINGVAAGTYVVRLTAGTKTASVNLVVAH